MAWAVRLSSVTLLHPIGSDLNFSAIFLHRPIAQGLRQFLLQFLRKNSKSSRGSCKLYTRGYEILAFFDQYLALIWQEAQVSQRDHALLHVIEYVVNSLKVTQGHLKQEITVELRVCPMQLLHFWSRDVHPVQNLLLCKKISSKSDDFSLRYSNISIFKMAAVSHLGIVLLPYETTYEVSVACRSCLSNFISIWYADLKI